MFEVLVIVCWLSVLCWGAVLFSEDVQPAAGIPITVTTTAETLVAVGFPLTLPTGNGKAAIRGWMDLTVGAGTTAITITIYRGSAIGGAVVGTRNPEAGDFSAGNTAHFEAEFIDLLQNVGQTSYCMSVQQTGATGNGTVLAGLIDTKLLSG